MNYVFEFLHWYNNTQRTQESDAYAEDYLEFAIAQFEYERLYILYYI